MPKEMERKLTMKWILDLQREVKEIIATKGVTCS